MAVCCLKRFLYTTARVAGESCDGMTTKEEVIEGLERFLGNHQIYDDGAIENAINFLYNEKTPEDMLSALAVVGDMDVAEQKHYFNITMDLTCSFDALYLLVKGCTPDMIFDAVEEYKDSKYKATMTAQKMKVRRLAEEIGLHNLDAFTQQLKKEAAEKCQSGS